MTLRIRMLSVCCAVLLTAAAHAVECCPAPAQSYTPPLSPQWRGAAYQGMIRQIQPKHVENVKFLFLGEPVPAMVKGGRRQPDMYGYGGLVAVRKKSILWIVKSSVRFYLVDANGNLLTLRDIDGMDEGDVSPKFYDVDIDVTVTYIPPTPTFTYDANGNFVPDNTFGNMGEWVTEEVKTVTPILDSYNRDRLRAFNASKVDRLPVCQ